MTAHEFIKKYTIGDGLPILVDPKRSKGSWVYDRLTKSYLLDCYSSFSSQPLGWNHNELRKAAGHLGEVALHKIANSDMYCQEFVDFLGEFVSITPDFSNYFFIEGGTLAVESGLKIAFDRKMRKMGETHDFIANSLDVIHLEQAFHGRSGYTMSLTNTKPIKTWGFPKYRWTRLTNPCLGEGQERRTEISLNQAEEALKRGHVAAVILEVIGGEGGDLHLPGDYLRALRELASAYDVLFIVDEVQTGLLTGKYWAYQHFDLKPDVLVFGKRTQACGVAVTSKVDDVQPNVFTQSDRINSTWGGDIVSMVRFYYISKIIKEEGLIQRSADVGSYFLSRLREHVDHARGRGLMIAFDLDSSERRDEVHERLGKNMLTLKCGDRSIRLRPPLTFTEEDVDYAIKFIKGVV